MERLAHFVLKGISYVPIVMVFMLFALTRPVNAQDAFMGYDYVTATYPLVWTTAQTTFNTGTASEIIYTMSGGALYTATTCNTPNINGYQINATAAFVEMQLTANSTTSTITNIAFTGSTNNNTTAGDAGVVFSDQYPFNVTSVIGASAVPFPMATGSWIVLNPTIPTGAKSMRIYRRIYYNSSTLTISTSTGTGFVQYGTGTTIRLASLGVTLAVSGTAPTVTTTAVTNITQTTASSGGNVTDAGTAAVTSRGVCWSTNQNPTIADTKTEDGSGIGSYTSSITGLAAGTTYYVRAYATNTFGTSYGGEETFNTLPGVADIVLSSDNPAVPIGDITAGTLKNPVYKFNLAVTLANTQLNQVDFTTAGTYTSSDVSKLQLWFNTADNFGTAVQIGIDITSIPGGVSNLSFGSLTQNINAGETGYLWITADVLANATVGRVFSVDAITITGLTFSSGNKSGTAFSGGLQTVVAAGNPDGYFRTKTTGDWNATSTWESSLDSVTWVDASLTPTNASKYINVRASHTVTVTDTVSVDQVSVDAGATIIVNGSPVVFTIVDGPDEIDMQVNGLLKATGSPNATAPYTVNAVGTLQFGSTGVYDHNQNSGGIPISQWTIGSTAMITGITGTTPANRNQSYYNLIWNCPNQSSNLNMLFDEVTIGGDISIISTGSSSRLYLCAPLTDSTTTVTINGNISQSGGQFSAQGTSNANTTVEVTVKGNITVTGGNFACTRGTQTLTGTTTWYFLGENFSISDAITQNSNTVGAKFLFLATTKQNLTLSNVTFSGGFPVEVAANSILDAGLSQIKGSGIFILNAGATLQSANAGGLDSLLQNTGTKTLSTLANYKFNGTVDQNTGNLLPSAVNELTIDNTASVTLSHHSVSAGTLNLVKGKLNTSLTNLLTVSGTLTNSIVGGNDSIYVNGPLALTLPSSLVVGSVYNYPIGKGSYKPLALVDPVSASGGPVVVSAEVFDANSGGTPGTGMVSLNTNRYWSANVVSGGANLTATKVRLTEDAMTSTMGIGKSSMVAGTYILISSAAPLGGTITSDDITSLSFFVIGEAASSTTFALSVAVTDGWNMVSVPGVNPGGQGVSTWWPNRNTLADVFKWTTTYEPVTLTAPREGYWMLHTGAQTYNYPAIQIVAHDPIPLTTGWNMIGGYENTPLVSGLTTTPADLIVPGTVYGWTGTYTSPTNLIPGFGYWILSNGNGVINPPTVADGPAKLVVQDDKSEWGKITITDASGKSYTLYSVNGEVNLDQYQMPPLPPTGMFDVRYGSNRKAENLKENNQTIEMRGLVYPVTVRVDKMGIKLEDETGKLLSERIKSGEEVVISNSAVSKLKVTSDIIPEVYSLDQNYPNPFNPSTKIEFSIPEDVNNVTLTIYNALGQKVAELVNSKMEAGKYSYVWNASDVATGLYIYELRTDKFISVKKMMLLK